MSEERWTVDDGYDGMHIRNGSLVLIPSVASNHPDVLRDFALYVARALNAYDASDRRAQRTTTEPT
jgi:hypothetical protein